ncbi:MAG TPA: uroporphyrinogen-III synthase [Candidatus Tumulicola sp.]|jgi:uroporphyrinogen-III synthase
MVTRPRDLAPAFIAELKTRGATVLNTPLIAIEPPDDPEPLNHALQHLHEFEWCAFTSANGVDALVSAFESSQAAARALQTLRVAALGPFTAERLAREGISVAAVPTEYVGESLAEAILSHARTKARVLIVRAQEGRDALSDALAAAGLEPTVVAAYRTVFVAPADFETNVRMADAITFASSSAVNGFVAAAGDPERARLLAAGKAIACIGPVAANTAREAGLEVDVVPPSYTGRGMIDALSLYFGRCA